MQPALLHSHRLSSRIYNSSLKYNRTFIRPNVRRTQQLLRVVPRASYDNEDDVPDWYKDIIEAAKEDPELAELLTTSGNNPAKVESRLRSEMDALHARITGKFGSGEEAPPEVTFRALDPFELWVWVELYSPPSASELEMTQEVINSWFMLGRLGAYNSSNLQVLYSSSGAGLDLEYDMAEASSGGMTSTMHDMGAVESNGPWLRFWVDMGTSDELAIDILINALMTFSREHVGVRQIVIGGENDDWAVPERNFERPEALTIDPYMP